MPHDLPLLSTALASPSLSTSIIASITGFQSKLEILDPLAPDDQASDGTNINIKHVKHAILAIFFIKNDLSTAVSPRDILSPYYSYPPAKVRKKKQKTKFLTRKHPVSLLKQGASRKKVAASYSPALHCIAVPSAQPEPIQGTIKFG